MKKLFYIFIITIFYSFPIHSFQIFKESKFLNFSDVHFDPFYDTTLVRTLMKSNYENWETIFANSSIKTLSSYGSDSNYPLLISALEEMRSRISNPDFIVITGDFMSHDFNENFEKYSGTNNTDSLHSFIGKTMKFVTLMIVKHYPATTIFPTVGNDDAYCGNYMVEPNGAFLKMLSEAWNPLVNKKVKNNSFKKNFAKGGYCMLNFPGNKKYKMIILNTVFFSTDYKNQCGDTSLDPGKDELKWLKETFKKCKKNNYKVWIAYHIPPGMDIYATINGKGDCEKKVTPTWKHKYNEDFIKIIKDNSNIIISNFAGHFHRDDFRIIYNNNAPVSYIHITPSISPVYGNNPSYQIIFYDKSNFNLINYESYYLKNISNPTSSFWDFEYDFQKSYEQRSISVSSLNDTYNLIQSDSSIRSKYIDFYTASNPKAFSGDYANWFYNWCGIGHLTIDDYVKCLCSDSVSYKH